VFPQNSPPTQSTSQQDSWRQTTNSNKQQIAINNIKEKDIPRRKTHQKEKENKCQ